METFQPKLFDSAFTKQTWVEGNHFQQETVALIRNFQSYLLGEHSTGLHIYHNHDLAGGYDEYQKIDIECTEERLAYSVACSFDDYGAKRPRLQDETYETYLDLTNPHTITYRDDEFLRNVIASVLYDLAVKKALEATEKTEETEIERWGRNEQMKLIDLRPGIETYLSTQTQDDSFEVTAGINDDKARIRVMKNGFEYRTNRFYISEEFPDVEEARKKLRVIDAACSIIKLTQGDRGE